MDSKDLLNAEKPGGRDGTGSVVPPSAAEIDAQARRHGDRAKTDAPALRPPSPAPVPAEVPEHVFRQALKSMGRETEPPGFSASDLGKMFSGFTLNGFPINFDGAKGFSVATPSESSASKENAATVSAQVVAANAPRLAPVAAPADPGAAAPAPTVFEAEEAAVAGVFSKGAASDSSVFAGVDAPTRGAFEGHGSFSAKEGYKAAVANEAKAQKEDDRYHTEQSHSDLAHAKEATSRAKEAAGMGPKPAKSHLDTSRLTPKQLDALEKLKKENPRVYNTLASTSTHPGGNDLVPVRLSRADGQQEALVYLDPSSTFVIGGDGGERDVPLLPDLGAQYFGTPPPLPLPFTFQQVSGGGGMQAQINPYSLVFSLDMSGDTETIAGLPDGASPSVGEYAYLAVVADENLAVVSVTLMTGAVWDGFPQLYHVATDTDGNPFIDKTWLALAKFVDPYDAQPGEILLVGYGSPTRVKVCQYVTQNQLLVTRVVNGIAGVFTENFGGGL